VCTGVHRRSGLLDRKKHDRKSALTRRGGETDEREKSGRSRATVKGRMKIGKRAGNVSSEEDSGAESNPVQTTRERQ